MTKSIKVIYSSMSSVEIASLTGKRHDNVLRDTREMLAELQIDALKFEAIYKDGANRRQPMIELDKRLTLILVSGYSVVLRARIIDRWQELESQAASHIAAREAARLEHRPMTDAIRDAHESPQPYHYSNEADLLNRIVLGSTSAKYRRDHEIEKDAPLRDAITPQQVIAIQHLQKLNTSMLELGMPYDERKTKLADVFAKKHGPALLAEFSRLEA